MSPTGYIVVPEQKTSRTHTHSAPTDGMFLFASHQTHSVCDIAWFHSLWVSWLARLRSSFRLTHRSATMQQNTQMNPYRLNHKLKGEGFHEGVLSAFCKSRYVNRCQQAMSSFPSNQTSRMRTLLRWVAWFPPPRIRNKLFVTYYDSKRPACCHHLLGIDHLAA